MEGLIISSVGMIAEKAYKDKELRGYIAKFLHMCYKKIFLANVICIVVEDCIRANLNIDVNDNKYIVLNAEAVLKTMMSDTEIEQMDNLKVENYDLYVMKYGILLKTLLNALRNQYKKDKQIILLLSSVSMSNALHVDNPEIYQMSDNLYKDVMKKAMTDKEKMYLDKQRQKHINDAIFKYENIDQLKDHLNNKYK